MRITIHAAGYPLTRSSYRLIRRRIKACLADPDWPGRLWVHPVQAGARVSCRLMLERRGGGLLRCEASGATLGSALDTCLRALRDWAPGVLDRAPAGDVRPAV